MKTCLNCNECKEEMYGSGRYCSRSCAASYSRRKETSQSTLEKIRVNVEQIVIKRHGELKEYQKKCHLCSCEFIVLEREFKHPEKEKYFCSRSCANNRGKMNKETKEKISAKLKKPPPTPVSVVCSQCGEKFFKNSRKKNQKFCSVTCLNRSPESRERSRNTAIKVKLGGNRNNRAWGWYTSPFAGKVFLESSYEYIVASELDLNQIEWERPKHLNYYDLSLEKKRKYFPDFFLKDFNVYLDPKNSFLIKTDIDKIKTVCDQNNVKILILDKESLEWKTIKNLLISL